MKCIIPGNNIKVFGRAIHSLSKIGDMLYIEALEHGLALRTVNSSRSAYACFLFAPKFFQQYDDGLGEINSQDSEDTLRCKIAMKSVLTVFRSVATVDKMVERCNIQLNMKDSRLVFQLYCRHGIVKTHNLAFIECETLQAVFSKNMCPNSLTASSKLLCDAVMNFQNNQEEITLIVNPEKIVLKNYTDDELDNTKVMLTNLTLEADEFDDCQIGVDTEVTFCLKELRAILGFSEATSLPITLKFDTSGRPVVFTIDSDSTFEGNFVLATLACPQSQSQPSTQAQVSNKQCSVNRPVSGTSQNKHNMSAAQKPDCQGDRQKQSNNKWLNEDMDKAQRMESAHEEEDLMNTDFDDLLIENNTTIAPGPSSLLAAQPRNTDSNNIKNLNVNPSFKGASERKKLRENEDSLVAGSSEDNMESPVIPVLGAKVKITENVDNDDENLDVEDEPIPGTPPAKRFRSLFFGSSQETTQTQEIPGNISTSVVLAEDTDED